jgi:predicted metal-dependent HD superfamily phosphohydrolase
MESIHRPQPPEFELPDSLWREVTAAYTGPGRAYHDLRHLDEVLGWFEQVGGEAGWGRPREVLLALLFHDAVYVVGRTDNEAESATLARRSIESESRLAEIDLARVEELIRLTARHGTLARGDVDDEAALFLDCDMSILGAAADRFDQYERDVALEYRALPAEVYRTGRRQFLQRLLALERIFLSDYFRARLEAVARANLRRALAVD